MLSPKSPTENAFSSSYASPPASRAHLLPACRSVCAPPERPAKPPLNALAPRLGRRATFSFTLAASTPRPPRQLLRSPDLPTRAHPAPVRSPQRTLTPKVHAAARGATALSSSGTGGEGEEPDTTALEEEEPHVAAPRPPARPPRRGDAPPPLHNDSHGAHLSPGHTPNASSN